MNLEDIAEKEELVLFDTSIDRLNKFTEYIYTKNHYSHLKLERIIYAKQKIKSFLNFVNIKNVYTIKQVCDELIRLEKILSHNASMFNRTERINVRFRKNKQLGKKKKEEYHELLGYTNELVRRVKRNIIKIEKKKEYDILHKSILKISKKIKNEKKDSEKQPRPYRKEYEDLETDEHLITTMVYLSRVKEKSSVIVTSSRNIAKLINFFYREICLNNLKTCKKKYLIENPIRVYRISRKDEEKDNIQLEDEDYELKFTSMDSFIYDLPSRKKIF